jgi:hypothetical protein
VSTDVSEEHIASIFRVEDMISARRHVASRIIRQPGIWVYIGNRRWEEDWNPVPFGSSV